MKTTRKKFDAVKYMRLQRDKLSEKLAKITKKEILEYFKKRKTLAINRSFAQQYLPIRRVSIYTDSFVVG